MIKAGKPKPAFAKAIAEIEAHMLNPDVSGTELSSDKIAAGAFLT